MTFQFHIALILLLPALAGTAQTTAVRENGKWGLVSAGANITPIAYDTIFPFDSTGRMCMACFESRTASSNKFMRIMVTTWTCNYLNAQGQRLSIKNNGDTCSVFSLHKSSVRQYSGNSNWFTASVKGSRNLVDKSFTQLTFNGYHEIMPSGEKGFYLAQRQNDNDVIMTGIVATDETVVVPFNYSSVFINPFDSLFIACGAGVRPHGADDIFDYNGRLLGTYQRHVHFATKHFVVHKLYEPREHFILFNVSTREERELKADEVLPSAGEQIRVRVKHDWYTYDLATNTKKPL